MKVSEMSLRGFLVSIHCPSEELLTVTVDCTLLPAARYMQLVTDLQDLLSDIDARHAAREARGRSLRARYRRVSFDQRLRLLKFSPFPSRIINKIKYIRYKAYGLLHRHCLVLTVAESGRYRENVFILPEASAEAFVARAEELDRELDEVRRFVAEFDLSDVQLLLSRYDIELLRCEFSIPHVRVDLLPIDLGRAIEEWAARSEAVRRLLQRKQEELMRGAVEDLRRRLEEVAEAMEGEARLAALERRLREVKALAEGLGLRALAEAVVAPLIEAARDPSALGGQRPSEFVRGRIASLFA